MLYNIYYDIIYIVSYKMHAGKLYGGKRDCDKVSNYWMTNPDSLEKQSNSRRNISKSVLVNYINAVSPTKQWFHLQKGGVLSG